MGPEHQRRPDGPGASAIIAAILLTLLGAAIAWALSVIVFFASIRVDACSQQSCDLAAGQVSLYVTPVVGVVAVLLTVIVGILLARRGRAIWIAPVLGMVLVVVSFAVALTMNILALTPSS